jgi:hypothetical protein
MNFSVWFHQKILLVASWPRLGISRMADSQPRMCCLVNARIRIPIVCQLMRRREAEKKSETPRGDATLAGARSLERVAHCGR